jgi:hypothetical protein
MDVKLEVVLPVADWGRAKAFYEVLGWRAGPDHPGEGDFQVMRLTPLGSRDDEIQGAWPTDRARL